ncbi:MAG: PIG-L family deacetylase [Chloroflexi bacterium]|nr:PIG-L family deacetylase [Chloroflexota bacterium]
MRIVQHLLDGVGRGSGAQPPERAGGAHGSDGEPAGEPRGPGVPARILVVYAHPDDESFGPSAVLAKESRHGALLAGVWATLGEHGQSTLDPPPAPAELARLREQDLREAAALIGFSAVEILGYEDGAVESAPLDRLAGQVLEMIRRHRPEVLLTFGPGGITGHPDHRTMHRAAVAAFEQARTEGFGPAALYYDAVPPEQAAEMGIADVPDGQPNTWMDVADTWAIKLDVLRMHGRHILDAREFVTELERRGQPARLAPLYRAWPPLPAQSGALPDPE